MIVVRYGRQLRTLLPSLASYVTDSSTFSLGTARGEVRRSVSSWSPLLGAMTAIDSVHHFTHLPWWMVISTTAVGIRLLLFPLTIKQIQSTGSTLRVFSQAVKIVRSQNSATEQKSINVQTVIRKFRQLMKYSDAPHPSWIIAAPLIQIPSFVVCVMSIRRMCQQNWPGFSEGGMLWFTDLTQRTVHFSDLTTPLGAIGAVLPIAVTLSYLTHIHISFNKGRVAANASSSLGTVLSKVLRTVLEWMSIPILLMAFQLPQGALIYWLTSSLYSVSQGLMLGHPSVRQFLSLPHPSNKDDAMTGVSPEVMDRFLAAAERRAQGDHDGAIEIIQKILELDPTNPRAHYALGQLLSEVHRWSEAVGSYRSSLDYESSPELQARSRLALGVAQFMSDDFQSSEPNLLAALEHNRRNVEVLMALVALYKRMGDSDRARAILDAAIAVDPSCKQWKEHL